MCVCVSGHIERRLSFQNRRISFQSSSVGFHPSTYRAARPRRGVSARASPKNEPPPVSIDKKQKKGDKKKIRKLFYIFFFSISFRKKKLNVFFFSSTTTTWYVNNFYSGVRATTNRTIIISGQIVCVYLYSYFARDFIRYIIRRSPPLPRPRGTIIFYTSISFLFITIVRVFFSIFSYFPVGILLQSSLSFTTHIRVVSVTDYV